MTGYKLVPVEPTEAMMRAGLDDYLAYERQGPQKSAWNGRTMWRAMLAVAIGPVFQHGDVEAIRQDAFDLGHKAAGGTIIPDRSKFVELALDRQTLNALAEVAEYICDPHGEAFIGDEFEKDRVVLRQFLENISIYRSRK